MDFCRLPSLKLWCKRCMTTSRSALTNPRSSTRGTLLIGRLRDRSANLLWNAKSKVSLTILMIIFSWFLRLQRSLKPTLTLFLPRSFKIFNKNCNITCKQISILLESIGSGKVSFSRCGKELPSSRSMTSTMLLSWQMTKDWINWFKNSCKRMRRQSNHWASGLW